MPSLGEIWNQFKLLEPLGQGGMGQVFLAQDATLDRKVALKFLPDRLEKDKRARTRFLREAKSAAALDHPYICKIYEIGEAEGRAFIAMEYIEGMTLAQKLAAGAMRIPDILDLGTEMGEAVDAAHKKGIVHRDLKPANIMVTPDGHIKILDFGVAKKIALDGLVEDRAQTASEQLTAHNATPGTVICMSPEQVRGESIDGRTDIFSLGTVFYEMATGAAPFEGATAGLVYDAILNRKPTSPRSINLNVPADLERIVHKALEKDREESLPEGPGARRGSKAVEAGHGLGARQLPKSRDDQKAQECLGAHGRGGGSSGCDRGRHSVASCPVYERDDRLPGSVALREHPGRS